MAIYGRFGDKVTIQRMAKIEDVRVLDGRRPEKRDFDAIKNDCYVVVSQDNEKQRLYHRSLLRADMGIQEIEAVINACKTNGGVAP